MRVLISIVVALILGSSAVWALPKPVLLGPIHNSSGVPADFQFKWRMPNSFLTEVKDQRALNKYQRWLQGPDERHYSFKLIEVPINLVSGKGGWEGFVKDDCTWDSDAQFIDGPSSEFSQQLIRRFQEAPLFEKPVFGSPMFNVSKQGAINGKGEMTSGSYAVFCVRFESMVINDTGDVEYPVYRQSKFTKAIVKIRELDEVTVPDLNGLRVSGDYLVVSGDAGELGQQVRVYGRTKSGVERYLGFTKVSQNTSQWSVAIPREKITSDMTGIFLKGERIGFGELKLSEPSDTEPLQERHFYEPPENRTNFKYRSEEQYEYFFEFKPQQDVRSYRIYAAIDRNRCIGHGCYLGSSPYQKILEIRASTYENFDATEFEHMQIVDGKVRIKSHPYLRGERELYSDRSVFMTVIDENNVESLPSAMQVKRPAPFALSSSVERAFDPRPLVPLTIQGEDGRSIRLLACKETTSFFVDIDTAMRVRVAGGWAKKASGGNCPESISEYSNIKVQDASLWDVVEVPGQTGNMRCFELAHYKKAIPGENYCFRHTIESLHHDHSDPYSHLFVAPRTMTFSRTMKTDTVAPEFSRPISAYPVAPGDQAVVEWESLREESQRVGEEVRYHVEWTAAVNREGEPVFDLGSRWSTELGEDTSRYVIRGLEPKTDYFIRVFAEDDFGQISQATEVASFQTPSVDPSLADLRINSDQSDLRSFKIRFSIEVPNPNYKSTYRVRRLAYRTQETKDFVEIDLSDVDAVLKTIDNEFKLSAVQGEVEPNREVELSVSSLRYFFGRQEDADFEVCIEDANDPQFSGCGLARSTLFGGVSGNANLAARVSAEGCQLAPRGPASGRVFGFLFILFSLLLCHGRSRLQVS